MLVLIDKNTLVAAKRIMARPHEKGFALFVDDYDLPVLTIPTERQAHLAVKNALDEIIQNGFCKFGFTVE